MLYFTYILSRSLILSNYLVDLSVGRKYNPNEEVKPMSQRTFDNIDDPYVGLAAGMVWHCLGQYGPITPPEIRLVTGLEEESVRMGIGWLAREGKIKRFKAPPPEDYSACLTVAELKIYRSRAVTRDSR